jgi:hypothetical protein
LFVEWKVKEEITQNVYYDKCFDQEINHRRMVHLGESTNELPVVCFFPGCGSSFKNYNSYSQHLKKHETSKNKAHFKQESETYIFNPHPPQEIQKKRRELLEGKFYKNKEERNEIKLEKKKKTLEKVKEKRQKIKQNKAEEVENKKRKNMM